MVQAKAKASGLSEADQRMMSNPMKPLNNFRSLMLNTAKQIVDIAGPAGGGSAAFVSDKLMNRQRQLKAEADGDLHQILRAQSRNPVLKGDFGRSSPLRDAGNGDSKQVLPSMGVDAPLRPQGEVPALQVMRRHKGYRPRANPTCLPSMGSEHEETKRVLQHSQKHSQSAMSNSYSDGDLECDMLEETEPVNRVKAPQEPQTEEERQQRKIANVCSQCRHGRTSEVKQAVAEGFLVDTQDRHGNSLLIIACQNNHKKIGERLNESLYMLMLSVCCQSNI